MSKIFMYVNKLLVKVTGHKYTSTTVKLPFINISFAPAQSTVPNGAVFSLFPCQSEERNSTLPLVGCKTQPFRAKIKLGGDCHV